MTLIFNPVLVEQTTEQSNCSSYISCHHPTVQGARHQIPSDWQTSTHKCAEVSNEDILQIYCVCEQGMSI